MSLAVQYGNFIDRITWADLPVRVQQTTLDLVADWVANAAAGFDSKIGKALFAQVSGHQKTGAGTLLGNLQQLEPLQAALINGGASHALEFDDAYRNGLYHPGAPVISAAWAAAGATGTSGPEFLTAVAAGYEISMRLAEAINPGHNNIWHTTGTIGTFGAAAGASVCLGLDAVQSTGALGLAGTQAAGLWEILPNFPQAKGLHAGKAAQSGLLAALLARQGILGPSTIFEGDRGVFRAMVPENVNTDTCVAGLGQEWHLARTTLKAYPVCGHTMTAIEAALMLAGDIETDAIEKIEIRAHPVSMGVAGNPDPRTELEAKFSIAFCVATALVRKKVTLAEFSALALSDPSIHRLVLNTCLVADDTLGTVKGQRPARVTVTLSNGSICSETAHTRKGDPENPLTRLEQDRKFLELVDGIWGRTMGQAVLDAIRHLPEYDKFNTWLNKTMLPWQTKINPASVQQMKHKG